MNPYLTKTLNQPRRGVIGETVPGDMTWMKQRFDELNEKSLLWEPPTLEGPNQPRCTMEGKPTIMLSANNYLNLTTHPKVVQAMVDATTTYGAGSGSVRAIAGTMDLHLEAERTVADFKGVEAALIYSAGYTCLLYTSPSPRDRQKSRMPSSA